MKSYVATDFEVRSLNGVCLKIQGINSSVFNYIEAFVVPMICAPLSGQVMELAKGSYEHLRNLSFADSNAKNENLDVDILIGANYLWGFSNGNMKWGKDCPVVLETTLGWALNGPVTTQIHCTSNFVSTHVLHLAFSVLSASVSEDEAVPIVDATNESLTKFWIVESTEKFQNPQMSLRMICFLTSKKIVYNGNRYETPLWKPSHDLLADNYRNCENRLYSLLRRL